MRLAVSLRILLYLLFGSTAALWLLSHHAYRGEWTIIDQMHSRREGPTYEYMARAECGWRLLGCRSLPQLHGPLASIAESVLAGRGALTCEREPFNRSPGPSGSAPVSMTMCGKLYGQPGRWDSVVTVDFDSSGSVGATGGEWFASQRNGAFDALEHGLRSHYGAPLQCPDSVPIPRALTWAMDRATSVSLHRDGMQVGLWYSTTTARCEEGSR